MDNKDLEIVGDETAIDVDLSKLVLDHCNLLAMPDASQSESVTQAPGGAQQTLRPRKS